MGCNNTLTDDQLEAMFSATDKEMQQTEQPMECVIERSKYKWNRCTRFFSNEAALKQHHCEPPVKQKNVPIVVKPSIAIRTCKGTKEVVRNLLHTLSNNNYVKWPWMDPLHPKIDSQYLRNW